MPVDKVDSNAAFAYAHAMQRNWLLLLGFVLASAGCAVATVRPRTPHSLPRLVATTSALPLAVSVESLLGQGNRPCEHLTSAVVARLREQHLVQQLQESWKDASAPVQMRLTFDCSFDDHPTLTLYTYMLMGGTFLLASPLPLFDLDYTARGTAEILHEGRLVRQYQVSTHTDGDYNYWAALQADPSADVIRQGEEDIVAQLVTAILNDRAFWEQLVRQSSPPE